MQIKQLLNRFVPFLIIGVALVALFFSMVIFIYLMIFGAIVGSVLFIYNWIRSRFFKSKKVIKTRHAPGRVIDSDDWHVL